ncbi:MAG TPA: hypothetical protein VKQ36_01405, partial [Ktedonobacterales bacterium]|nr:hypothetical protein [Ktedonobacterales bacterium]
GSTGKELSEMATTTCLGCGQSVTLERMQPLAPAVMQVLGYPQGAPSPTRRCPRCLCPEGWTLPVPARVGGQTQVVHTYVSRLGHLDTTAEFAQDAAALSRVGWRVVAQSPVGVTQLPFSRKQIPRSLTVTYVHDDR